MRSKSAMEIVGAPMCWMLQVGDRQPTFSLISYEKIVDIIKREGPFFVMT